MKAISFFYEGVNFRLADDDNVKNWISLIAKANDREIEELSFIFCSDEYLHSINLQYLNHDTYTDIITFDNGDDESYLAGDIFISVERVEENAGTYQVSFTDEIHRVMIHGVLHLLGFDDTTDAMKKNMREKEAVCLSLRNF